MIIEIHALSSSKLERCVIEGAEHHVRLDGRLALDLDNHMLARSVLVLNQPDKN